MIILEGFFDFFNNKNKKASGDVGIIEEIIFDSICEYSENNNFIKKNSLLSYYTHPSHTHLKFNKNSDTYRYIVFESDKFTIDYFSDSDNSDYILLNICVTSLDPLEKDIDGMIEFASFVKDTFTSYDITLSDRIKGLLKKSKYSFITGDILIKLV